MPKYSSLLVRTMATIASIFLVVAGAMALIIHPPKATASNGTDRSPSPMTSTTAPEDTETAAMGSPPPSPTPEEPTPTPTPTQEPNPPRLIRPEELISPGETIRLVGTGYRPNRSIDITSDVRGHFVSEQPVQTDSSGAFDAPVVTSKVIPMNRHTIVATETGTANAAQTKVTTRPSAAKVTIGNVTQGSVEKKITATGKNFPPSAEPYDVTIGVETGTGVRLRNTPERRATVSDGFFPDTEIALPQATLPGLYRLTARVTEGVLASTPFAFTAQKKKTFSPLLGSIGGGGLSHSMQAPTPKGDRRAVVTAAKSSRG